MTDDEAPGTLRPSMSIPFRLGVPGTVATLMSAVLLSMTVITAPVEAARIPLKSGQKIGFMGDSITEAGAEPQGYVTLVIRGLEANGILVSSIPAGISGHKSNQMLERLDRDVLSKKPDWMTLSCGVNDVWHGPRGVPLDDAMAKSGTFDDKVASRGTYQKNIAAIIDRAIAAGVKPVMLTATVIQEDLESRGNGQLAPYNAFLRQLAKEKHLPLADLFAMFEERIKKENKPTEKVLTSDGVHMNTEGNKLMAIGVLKAFGLDEGQLEKAKVVWAPLEVAAAEAAKKQAEARAKAAAEKAKAAPKK